MGKITLLSVILLFLVGCFGVSNEKNPPPEQTQPQENVEKSIAETEKGPFESDKDNQNKEKVVIEEKEDPVSQTVPEQETQYTIDAETWTVTSLNKTKEKSILLTIDDAPDEYALEMATLLKKMDVPAIFFVNGHFLDTPNEEKTARLLYELGFPIGNHTMNHKNLSQLDSQTQKEEIMLLNNKIESITGEKPRFFRAPFGINTDIASEIVMQEGMIKMNWTYGYDWLSEYQDKEQLTEIMVNTPLLGNGSILLMHDRKWSAEALEGIITCLRQKGYEFIDPNYILTN